MSVRLKARDIIPGWPRGRSTADMWPDWKSVDMWEVFWPTRGEKIAELKLDREYHEAQQEMVNRFIERWRTLDLTPRIRMRWIDDEPNIFEPLHPGDYWSFSTEAIQMSLKMINDHVQRSRSTITFNDHVQRITGATPDQMAAAWHESASKFMDTNFMEK